MRSARLGTSAEVWTAWPCGTPLWFGSGGAAASACMDAVQETTGEETPPQGDHEPSTSEENTEFGRGGGI